MNGQVVAFVDGTSPLRCHHLDCHWRCSRLQKHFSAGARVLIDSSVSDEDRERVKAYDKVIQEGESSLDRILESSEFLLSALARETQTFEDDEDDVEE